MYFEILVEDLSGKKALDILIPKIIDMNAGHTFRVHSYKGSLEKSAIQSQIYFCIAVEEGEAWYLGDINAIKIAYPQAKSAILDSYINDSICGTWEKLADAIYRGGAKQLSKLGGASVGQEKTVWAENISPQMNVDINRSPSFGYFRDKLRHLSQEESR